MEFICSLYDLGYVSAVLASVNLVILTALKKDRKFSFIIFGLYVALICMLPLLPASENYLTSIICSPKSPSEKFLTLGIWALTAVTLFTMQKKIKSIVVIILTVLWAFADFLLFELLIDVVGIIVFIDIIKTAKNKFSTEIAAIIVVMYLFILITIPLIMSSVSWKGIFADYREQNITQIYHYSNRGIDSTELAFYVMNNIVDTEERLCSVVDIVVNNDNGTFEFLEDSVAAFTFYRSSLQEPALFDNTTFSYNTDVGSIIINRKDNHFYMPIEYKTTKQFDFQLYSQSDTTLTFYGGFSEPNFAVLCCFQKYLESCGYNYIGKTIFLLDSSHNTALNMLYHDKDMYDIWL